MDNETLLGCLMANICVIASIIATDLHPKIFLVLLAFFWLGLTIYFVKN